MILAFDVTNQSSFENISYWIESLQKHAEPGIPKVFVGNKIDLEEKRVVAPEKAMAIAIENDMKYFDTSAKKN